MRAAGENFRFALGEKLVKNARQICLAQATLGDADHGVVEGGGFRRGGHVILFQEGERMKSGSLTTRVFAKGRRVSRRRDWSLDQTVHPKRY